MKQAPLQIDSKKVVLFFIILFSFISNVFCALDPIEARIKDLSHEEKVLLENFFEYVIRTSTFGYVLIGDKPFGIETYETHSPLRSIEGIDYMDDRHILDKYRLREGWEVWNKIKDRFDLNCYVLFSYPLREDFTEICFLSRPNFICCVNAHLDDFHKVLGKKLSAEEILTQYLDTSSETFKCIQEHDGLLGTLLGFGRNNAWTYMLFSECKDFPLGSAFGDLTDDPSPFLPPLFRAMPTTQETKGLVQKYIVQRERLESIYKKGRFFQTTMELIQRQR